MGMPAGRYFSPSASPAALDCALCPRRCRIRSGAAGRCGVRRNRDGAAYLPCYGLITALAEDPIEKKPLYHFRPGSSILSLGFALCNLRCPFCQNWAISQPDLAVKRFDRRLSPAQAVALARERGFSQIAYTYSEPLIHIEWLLDCMALCRRAGIATALVTNGCVNKAPAAEILALTDAANVDLKCFSAETYEKVLGGNLDAVLRFIEAAHRAGTHLEITTLVVPGLNDSEAETRRCAEFIAGLSPGIPWHLSAYHPDYRYEAPATAPAALAAVARMAREQLRYVYTGNIPGERNDTPCPCCGAMLVSRRGYRVDTRGLSAQETGQGMVYRCARRGAAATIRAAPPSDAKTP
uniref:Pyruvate-formate lyase activating enzyme n=1 Tax=uncultured Treponema sp. TaxID=162155 RepID=A0A387JU61_9SPIR|nr:pyruvate-formate lyase activating enzyme [uncultured Treponema sp.]